LDADRAPELLQPAGVIADAIAVERISPQVLVFRFEGLHQNGKPFRRVVELADADVEFMCRAV
jgi:hypothetical protein